MCTGAPWAGMLTLDELLAVYGDPHDVNFEIKQLVKFTLPYPLIFNTAMVREARCHRLAVAKFVAAYEAIKDAGLVEHAAEYGGIYNMRNIRGHPRHLSAHSWGIAIDVEPSRFPLGSTKDQHPGVVKAFADQGFAYGGNFKSRRDPMHFSLAGF